MTISGPYLPALPMVRFCMMAHFLEHVPNKADVVAIIGTLDIVLGEVDR